MQDTALAEAAPKYDLEYLLKNPRAPLTADQWNNFDDLFMRMENDDKPASEVDIGPAVRKRMKEIDEKGTFWR
jgi:hypothetical protein